MLVSEGIAIRVQIVHLSQSNARRVVYTPHDRRVIACWQFCDDCRFPSVARSVAAVPDIAYLVAGDDSADDRVPPVIIRGNQSSSAVVQFQRRISQNIGNAILTEFRANGANNDSFWFGALQQ